MDFQRIWHDVKHGPPVSEVELTAAESALRSIDCGDRHLPILIVGVARQPEPSLVLLMESFLESQVDAERYCALRALCRYWEQWEKYVPYLLNKISIEAYDTDLTISFEAFNLLGAYLAKHTDRAAWRRLVSVYDSAVETHRWDVAGDAYSSMYRALFGAKASLRRTLSKDPEHDPEVLAAARSCAGLTEPR